MNVSVKTKFMMMIVFMIIFSMICAFSISVLLMYKSMSEKNNTIEKQKVKMVERLLDRLKRDITIEGKTIAEDKKLIGQLMGREFNDKSEKRSSYEIYSIPYNRDNFKQTIKEFKNSLSNDIQNLKLLKNRHIAIIGRDTEYIYNMNPLKNYNESKEVKEALGLLNKDSKTILKIITIKVNEDKNGKEETVIKSYFKLYTPVLSLDNNKTIGLVVLTYKIDRDFLNKFKIQTDDDEILIFDKEENYLLSTFDEKINIYKAYDKYDFEAQNSVYRLKLAEIKNMNEEIIGYLALAFNKNQLLKELSVSSSYLFLALFFVFSFMFVIANYSLNLLIDAIKNLTLKINSLREGNFKIKLTDLKRRNDEIGILAQDFEEMVNMLKNKIEQLEDADNNNKDYSGKLEIANKQLEGAKKELESKNLNIDRINKMLNNRITEISSLYYLVINISKYMVDHRFYNIVVKGIREGLHFRRVIIMENSNNVLKVKSKLGVSNDVNDIVLDEEMLNKLTEKDILELEEIEEFEFSSDLKMPYLVPLAIRTKNKKELFGVIVLDNEEKIDKDVMKSITTYTKTINLAFQNRNLYLKLVKENQKLENTTIKLKDSEKLRNIFLANVSHELKVPLVPIKGYSEIMLGGSIGDLTVTQRRVLISSLHNVERLQRIIENILNFSRIEGGKYDLLDEKFNIITVINEVIDDLRNLSEKKMIKYKTDFEQYEINVLGDKEAIKQVLINIISNSIKFSKERGDIDVIIRSVNEKWNIIIKDYGVGMDKNKIKNIFDSFKQLEEGDTRKYGGLGLGLTVAQKILEHYEEKIYIESQIDKGTEVSLYFTKN